MIQTKKNRREVVLEVAELKIIQFFLVIMRLHKNRNETVRETGQEGRFEDIVRSEAEMLRDAVYVRTRMLKMMLAR